MSVAGFTRTRGGRRGTLLAALAIGAGGLVGSPSAVVADVAGAVPGTASGAAAVIAAGTNHSCALLEGGNVKCWGANNFGQLGAGDTVARGDGAGEMGDALPVIALGTGRTATAIAAGNNHTCALLDDASVKCWGYNFRGQLGLGDTAHRGDGGGEMGDSLPAVALGPGRVPSAITAGANHSCALFDDGTVKCWGDNLGGKLGLGDTVDRGDGPNEMGDDLPVLMLGTGRTATAITAGANHTCSVLDDGTVKCWGDNAFGKLGLGDTDDRG